jgi:hypothetical protein
MAIAHIDLGQSPGVWPEYPKYGIRVTAKNVYWLASFSPSGHVMGSGRLLRLGFLQEFKLFAV